MDPTDYIADLEEEVETLRGRVADLEEELDKVREELRLACERKVEEVSVLTYFYLASTMLLPDSIVQPDDRVPSEENDHRNSPKKEETPASGLGSRAVKHEVKREVKHWIEPKKTVSDTPTPVDKRGSC